MPGPEAKERRKFPRFSISLPLTYCNLSSKRINQAEIHNISEQGIGFVTNEELTPGTYLEIWINLPDNHEQIYLKGKVVWEQKLETNQYGIGINLVESRLKPIPIVLRAIQIKL